MGFLEDLVIPLTSEHVTLLSIFQIISLLLFLPFMGMVLGGSFFSLLFSAIGNRNLNSYFRFANDIMAKLTINVYVGLGLCIIPLIAVVFIYTQLLYGTELIIANILEWSVILYLVGIILIYIYKKTIRFVNIVDSYRSYKKLIGWIGLFFLIAATFIFVGSLTIASNPQNWIDVNNVFGLFTSEIVWLYFLYFISASLAITGAAVLFFFFRQGGIKEMGEEYSSFVRRFGVGLTVISVVIQLLILFATLVVLPQDAYSDSIFFFSAMAIVSIFLTAIFVYAVLRDTDSKYAGVVFLLVLLTFTFTIIKDQIAFGNSNKEHFLAVTTKADELNEKKDVTEINAEELFNINCIACHKFDVKLVGPPYNETIPKYNGDVQKLAKFILNPVKVNPEYTTPMPNLGLKKEQAEALAKFLIEKVQKK